MGKSYRDTYDQSRRQKSSHIKKRRAQSHQLIDKYENQLEEDLYCIECGWYLPDKKHAYECNTNNKEEKYLREDIDFYIKTQENEDDKITARSRSSSTD